MITDTYNRNSELNIADNRFVCEGEVSKKTIVLANSVANTNHAPALSFSERTTSFSKSMPRDDNPIADEMMSDGLGALFGAATGLDCIEMIIDYGCDAVEFYDEFVQDRYGNNIPKMPVLQPDPRLWSQPMPGMSMAA